MPLSTVILVSTSRPKALPRDFWLYLASRFCSATGLTLLRATVAWHVYELSNSAMQLGLLGLVQFLPAVSLSLLGGAVADTYDRRRIIILAQTVPSAAGLLLCTATAGGWVGLPLLYALVGLVASAAAFDNPARASMLASLVQRETFPQAVTLATAAQALAFSSGPALAGLLIATTGLPAAYVGTTTLLLGSMIGISRLAPFHRSSPSRGISRRLIVEGLAFVRSNEVILGCMTLDMFAVIFGGSGALLPIYAREILKVGPQGFGILAASIEIGALITSVLLLYRPPVQRAGRVLLSAVIGYGTATIVFGLSRSFPLSVLAYLAVGMADQLSVVMRHTMIQLNTPDELRGRVSSVNFIFIGASNQLGAVESGFVAALTSAPFAVVSGGLFCLAVVALVIRLLPKLGRATLEVHA